MSKGMGIMKLRFFYVFFFILGLFLNVETTYCQSTSSPFAWPEISRQTKPWSRWWWMGNSVNEKDLTTVMEAYQKAGLGGLEITPIYGVKGYEDRFIDYLSPQWMELFDYTLKEASRLDLGIDMATGTGWPFGGPDVGDQDACKNIAYKTYTLTEGQKLAEPVVYRQQPLVHAVGNQIYELYGIYKVEGEKTEGSQEHPPARPGARQIDTDKLEEAFRAKRNMQEMALDQVKFERQLPLQVLMAYSEDGQKVNLTDWVDGDGKLDWVAPEGKWTLYAVFQGWHGKMVERAAPGGEGNVIDHFSSAALLDYLKKFDVAFADTKRPIRAFFNDSYEVDDAAGEADYTPNLFDEFEARRGYDLRDFLPALFGKDIAENNGRVLCDYRETISDLLLDEFTLTWKDWAETKGAIVRDQAHGSPANILDLYAASDIPETEGTDLLRIKFASSAAHVSGKPLTSSESATWLNEHFLSTLGDVKNAVDRYFLGGVNHIFYHGTTYSPPDESWPGWLFYASVNFAPSNSLWGDFSALNDYVARCQSFLQSGAPDNNVLLYFPIYDKWSQPGRTLLEHFTGGARDYEGTSFQSCAMKMLERGYAFDMISDGLLDVAEWSDNAVQTEGGGYKTVLLPECGLIPLGTFEKLVNLAERGAVILVHNELPQDVPGLANLEKRRKAFNGLKDRIDLKPVENSDMKKAQVGRGAFIVGNDIDQLLSQAGVDRESMVDSGLDCIRRNDSTGFSYFIANRSDNPVNGWIPIGKSARSFILYDPIRVTNGLAAQRSVESGQTEIYLQLDPGESCILKAAEETVQNALYPYFERIGQPREIPGKWSVRFIEGGPELPSPVEETKLASWTDFGDEALKAFSGTAEYSISFAKPDVAADGWLLDLGRVAESARIILNGLELAVLIEPPFTIRIDNAQLRQNNTLEIKVSNLMANRIAYLDQRGVQWKKFYNVNFPAGRRENRGEDGLFDASKWPPRESGLIGPVSLTPIRMMTF
jgi:hypothetical protein